LKSVFSDLRTESPDTRRLNEASHQSGSMRISRWLGHSFHAYLDTGSTVIP